MRTKAEIQAEIVKLREWAEDLEQAHTYRTAWTQQALILEWVLEGEGEAQTTIRQDGGMERARNKGQKRMNKSFVPIRQDGGLLPCPFCGGDAAVDKYVISRSERRWGAYCRNGQCGVRPSSREFDTEAQAIEAWNTRHGESESKTTKALKAIDKAWEALTEIELNGSLHDHHEKASASYWLHKAKAILTEGDPNTTIRQEGENE